jgi:hypothetical protein
MKKNILSICTLIFLFACKKDNSNTPSSTGKILTSIWANDLSGSNVLTVDSLSYDNIGRLLRIIQWDYDNTQDSALYDSVIWKFTYNGSGNTPSTYSTTLYYAADNNENYTEDHTLSYDNQSRVIFDTSLAVYTSGSVPRESYFKYTAAYTVINQAAAHKDITDTIFMNNGNISKFSAYADSLGTGNFDFGYAYTYAGTPNPLYNSTISACVGPLLYVRTNLDFISKYLPAASKDIFYAPDLVYSYTANSLGLPVKGLAKDRTTGELEKSVTYNYQ